ANGAISARTLTMTANNTSKVYGQTVTFAGTEFTSSGLQNGETIGSVTLSSAGATASATVAGSPYSIVPSAAIGGTFTASNYTINYVSGNLTVNKASTATAVASSQNSSTFGQSVTFTATVTVQAPGAGTPTGTVNFKDGNTIIGSGALDVTGHATFTTTALTAAGSPHSITAVYAGDGSSGNFNSSTSPALSQVVNMADTTTALVSSGSPTVFGQSVTFTATVSTVAPGAGTPTGTVSFKDGTTTLLTPNLVSGQATFTTT